MSTIAFSVSFGTVKLFWHSFIFLFFAFKSRFAMTEILLKDKTNKQNLVLIPLNLIDMLHV